MDATIVKLGPSNEGDGLKVVSFEEAFGEYSELRGRGVAKRQAKKTARQATRQAARVDRKTARVANRQAVKMNKVAAKTERKVAKQGIKTAKKAAKQERRAGQQEARQVRKDTRVTRRLDRKLLRKESRQGPQEEYIQEDNYAPQDNYTPQDNYAPQEDYSQQGYDEPQDDYAPQEEYIQEDNYEPQEEYAQDDSQQNDYAPQYSQDEYEVMKQFEPEYEDYESESFDGDSDSNDFTSDADGTAVSIEPTIGNITSKIVWNQEARRRAMQQKANLNKQREGNRNNARMLSSLTSQMNEVNMKIEKHNNRIDELKKQLKSSYGDHPHIAKGIHQAEVELQKRKEKKTTADDAKKVQETIVSKSLDPQFGENRIDVPAYPTLNKIEIQSSADGSGSEKGGVVVKLMQNNTTKWVVGLTLLGVGLYLAKKYKYI